MDIFPRRVDALPYVRCWQMRALALIALLSFSSDADRAELCSDSYQECRPSRRALLQTRRQVQTEPSFARDSPSGGSRAELCPDSPSWAAPGHPTSPRTRDRLRPRPSPRRPLPPIPLFARRGSRAAAEPLALAARWPSPGKSHGSRSTDERRSPSRMERLHGRVGRRSPRQEEHASPSRFPRTGRELSFIGPALVEPCVGTDEAWLVRGRFLGSRGTGESPGAEQWVVTPFARGSGTGRRSSR